MSLINKLGKTGKKVAVGAVLLTGLVSLSGCPRSVNNSLGGLAGLYLQTRVVRKAWGDDSSDSNSNKNYGGPQILIRYCKDLNHDRKIEDDEIFGLVNNGPIDMKNVGYIAALVEDGRPLPLKSTMKLDPNYNVVYKGSDKITPDLGGMTDIAAWASKHFSSGVYTLVFQAKNGETASRRIMLEY